MMTWEEALWAEIRAQPDAHQITVAGEIIAEMQRRVVRDLAEFRRTKAVELIESGEYNYGSLADEIGNHAGTIRRLVEEGRAQRRERDAQQAA
jgi:hypothetical protein